VGKSSLTLLDVGCGSGSLTLDLASLLSDGHVVGVDASESALHTARALAKDRCITNVTFLQGDAMDLKSSFDFEDESFDIVHAHQVLVHQSPDAAIHLIRQMQRIAKPGGIICSRDIITSTWTWYPSTEQMRTTLKASVNEIWRVEEHKDADLGNQLITLAMKAGFDRGAIDFSIVTELTASDPESRAIQMKMAGVQIDKLEGRIVGEAMMTKDKVEDLKLDFEKWAQNDDAWCGYMCGAIVCHVGDK